MSNIAPTAMPYRLKRILPALILPALLAATHLSAEAQNLIANGDFESGAGTGMTRNFDVTPNWYNRAGKQDAVARRNDLNQEGSSFNALVTDRSGVPVHHSQRTEYRIQAGDAFNISFDWMDNAISWNNRDFIRVTIFATDDDRLDGNVVWEHSFDSPPRALPGSWETLYGQSPGVDPAAVGRRLFVGFYGLDPQGEAFTTPGYARIDNLSVTVARDR